LAIETFKNLEFDEGFQGAENFLQNQFDIRLENLLIAKNTIDERYYWIGKRKMSAAKSMGDNMTKVLEKNQGIESEKTGLDAFL